jgi:hypothetical protein
MDSLKRLTSHLTCGKYSLTSTTGGNNMTELGLFNDEGLMEGQFYSMAEAQLAIAERYTPEDGLVILKICADHPEQADKTCEDCAAEWQEE